VDPQSFIATARTILFETDFGPVWLVRLSVVVALLVAGLSLASTVSVLALVTILLGSEAWIGHAVGVQPLRRSSRISLPLALVRRALAAWPRLAPKAMKG
jgi:putative copper export protein